MPGRSDIGAAFDAGEPLLRPRRSLGQEAADAVRELILLEKLPPGAPIAERDLAERLGVSRTPMREALRLLATEGLVDYSATRRPHVSDPSLSDLTQYLMVQGALEALAGERACLNATEDDLAEIERHNARMTESSDTSEPLDFFRTDMAFHAAIVRASYNPPLIETHRQYNARLWRARFISSRMRTARDNTLRQHDQITRALMARDRAAAAAALRAHLDTAVVNIAQSLMTAGAGPEPQERPR